MSKISCIQHRAKTPLVILHQDYLDICQGCIPAAIILKDLEYWTDIKIANDEQVGIENRVRQKENLPPIEHDYWIYKSYDELCEDSLGLLKGYQIREGLKMLLGLNFIASRNNPRYRWDRKLQYRLNAKVVQDALNNDSIRYGQRMDDESVTNGFHADNEAIPETPTETPTEIIESPVGDNTPTDKKENHSRFSSITIRDGTVIHAGPAIDMPDPFIKQDSPNGSELDNAFPRPPGYNPPQPRRPLKPIEALVGGYTPSPNPEDTPLIERAQADLQASGWDIRSKDMRHALTYFTAYTPFVVPNSDSERKGWLKYIKVHLDEFGLMTLPDLYRQATAELFDPDKMEEGGYRPPTGPWGYTKTMHGIKAVERIEAPDYGNLPTPSQEEYVPDSPFDEQGNLIDIFNPPKGYRL